MFQIEIESRIAEMRIKYGKTQAYVSEKTGIHTTTLSAYENNKRIPNAKSLWLIAVAIGCKVDSLYRIKKII